MSQKILQYVEVDTDVCSLTYGVNPCHANATALPTQKNVLLMHFNSVAPMEDFSPSAHRYSAIGAGTGTTGAQIKFGDGSCVFNGTTSFIRFPDSPDWHFAGDFTIDLWVRMGALPASGQVMAIASQYGGDSVSYWMIYVDQNGSVYFHQVINGIAYYTGGPSVITTATWFHIAVVRSGNSQRLYINGVGGPVEPTHLQADIAGSLEIGVWAGGGYFLNGYLDEVRFANYARWPITSNFTPPTAADTALASDLRLYNKLLLNFEGDLTDASPAARGSGTPNVAFNYNPGTGYFGSYSGYFNGSNQYVLFSDSDDFDFGTGDFSIDFFEYRVAAINSSAVLVRDTSVAPQAFLLGHEASGQWQLYMASNASTWDIAAASVAAIDYNVWTHWAVVRNGTTFRAYKNGTQAFSTTSSLALLPSSGQLQIGKWSAGFLNGYIDHLRISRVARSTTTTFPVPTQPDVSPTSTKKCFNTLVTCQDRLHYTSANATLRLAVPTKDLRTDIDCIPNIKDIQFDPAVISLGKDLGQRATLTVNCTDHRHSDTGIGFDKYYAERPYDPYQQGTMWGKFHARQPYLRGRSLRWITGNTDQTLAEMEARHYIVDSFSGPDNSGNFKLIAKDMLKLADGDRALAPVASAGSLVSDITAATGAFNATPSGVGATYPASGYIAIGGTEICLFSRSGDTFTITRGQLGTAANTHTAGDRVQLVIRYVAQQPQIIIQDLLQNYAGVEAIYIPIADWTTEINAHLNRLYTATIAQPTSVNTLISELIEQAGLSMWWNDRDQEIGLMVLRGMVFTNYLFTEHNILADTLEITEQPDKRLSQVHTYFGQINPLTSLTDKANYRSVSRVLDLQKEADYGSAMIKEIFSRWIPTGGRTVADRLGAILLARFKDPPRKIAFSSLRNSTTSEIILANGYQVQSWPLQDDTGAPDTVNVQVTRMRPSPDVIEIESEEVLIEVTAEDLTVRNIIIDSNLYNFNLRAAHDLIYPAPTAGITVILTIYAGVFIGSTSTSLYACDIGSWPAGVTIIVHIIGRIQGKGAMGIGTLGGGENGGSCIYTRYPIKLSCPGQLWSGGGGGGFANHTDGSGNYYVWGGGGGAGYDPGAGGGSNSYAGNVSYPGTTEAGGSAFGYSGAGGGPGLAGNTSTALEFGAHAGTAPGYSVDGWSYVTTGTWNGTAFTPGAITGDRRGPTIN